MATEIRSLRSMQLYRLKRNIRRDGPIDWQAARIAMWAGDHNPRDAKFDNMTILEFITAGELTRIEQPDGSSLIGCN